MFTPGSKMSEHKEFEKDVMVSESREMENLDLHEREYEVAFLSLVNESKRTSELVHAAVSFFRERLGLEAVGLRLQEGNDYPHFESVGFSEEFVKIEKSLFTRDEFGRPFCDNTGNPILKCMCGNIICGRIDPSKPFFTVLGNFWSNSITELLASASDANCLEHMLNSCKGNGYESVALIALTVDDNIFGLLQLNDTRKGQFSQEIIIMLERLAGYLAMALSKARVEELLLEAYETLLIQSEKLEIKTEELQKAYDVLLWSEEKYRDIVETAYEGVSTIDSKGMVTYANKKLLDMLGYNAEEIINKSAFDTVEDVGAFKKKLEERRRGINDSHELKLICKDGSKIWVHVNAKSLFNEKGEYKGSLGMFIDVTKRKQNEKALLESETRFRALAENSPDIITRFDRQYRHVYANPAAAKSYRVSLDEIIGKTQGELGRDLKNVKFWEKHLENTFVTGKTETIEYHYISPQGKKCHFNTKIVPEFDDGKITSALAISRDISDIREAEAKLNELLDNLEKLVKERTAELEIAYDSLKESERGLAEAQEMAHIGNWDWNILTNKLYYSDELYRIFGLNPQELDFTFDEVLNYIHPDDRDYVNNAVRQALNGKRYDEVDFRAVLADGTERVVHAKGGVIFDENNNLIRIKGTVQDITERIKSEKEIRNLASIVESSNDAIITKSLDGNITSWNKGAEQVYGYSAEDILGKSASILAPPHLGDETKILSKRINQGESVKDYETLRRRKDGKIIDVSITISPVYDLHGKLIATSFISRDITKRIETEKALANFEIAREKEIHHRIKNNLQVISSLLDLQADKFKDKKNIRDSEVIDAFKESQSRVISMALIHEELYKGGGLETINFSEYSEKLADNLLSTYRLGNTDISLNMDLKEDFFLNMDTAIPLGIIVNELISNSFKHAFLGRDKGEIRIKLHREERNFINIGEESNFEDPKSTNLILSVSDNGVGIPKNLDIENLDSLGLQLVTSLVDQLNGELEIKRNSGTEFSIRFPVTGKDSQVSMLATCKSIE